MSTVAGEVADRARREASAYASASGEERPLSGYLALGGTYAAAVAGVAAVTQLRGVRLPERIDPQDIVLIGVATHKLSRILGKAGITSPLRAPFTRFRGRSGPAELDEDTRATGVGKAVGELVTCPFCLGQWVATGFVAGLVNAPRLTRVVASVFASLALADFLHLAYGSLEQAAE
jgi:Protein of unknown function (DUF1360)